MNLPISPSTRAVVRRVAVIVLATLALPGGPTPAHDEATPATPSVAGSAWTASGPPAAGSVQLMGTFDVLWQPSASPFGETQFLLRDGSATWVLEPRNAPDINLWEFRGREVAAVGNRDGTHAALLDGSGTAPVLLTVSIQLLQPLSTDSLAAADHAAADSLALQFAETAPEFTDPPAASATPPVDAGTRPPSRFPAGTC